MSEQKHTPGPWRVDDSRVLYESDGHYAAGLTVVGDDGEAAVAEMCGHTAPLEATANARRIVACVNACEGLSTEQLERFPLDSFKECAQAGIAATLRELELEKQRDELIKERDSLGESLRLVAEQADKWRVETLVFVQQRDELLRAAESCLADLEHYVRTHGPGPDARLYALRAAIAKCKQ